MSSEELTDETRAAGSAYLGGLSSSFPLSGLVPSQSADQNQKLAGEI